MLFNVTLSFGQLRCWQPNETADEPFLWTFSFAIDGSTVRQNLANPKILIPSVKVQTGLGSHENLPNPEGEAYDGEFDTYQNIPPQVGHYKYQLSPIPITLLGKSLAIPGMIGLIYILMEEDATSDSGIERGHQDLRDFIERRMNEFLSDIDLIQITNAALARSQREGIAIGAALLAEFLGQFSMLEQQLKNEAQNVVENGVLEDGVFDWGAFLGSSANSPSLGTFAFFSSLTDAFDPDDNLGTVFKKFNQKEIIEQNLSIPFGSNITPLNEDGQWSAFYELSGWLSAQLVPQPNDFKTTYKLLNSQMRQDGEIDIEPGQLCMPPGPLQWELLGNESECVIRFSYPFVKVKWSVNGIVLEREQKNVSLVALTQAPVAIMANPYVEYRDLKRQINIEYEIISDALGESLILRNNPMDGNYIVKIGHNFLLPNGTEIAAGSKAVAFDGLAIESPSLKAREACLHELYQLGRFDVGKKFITQKDLWGPYSRSKALTKVTEKLQQIAIAENWSEKVFDQRLKQAKNRLKID